MAIWIESHVELSEHPKVFVLTETLGVRRAETVGLLHMLWHFTMKYAWRDGDLSKFDDIAIARGSGWELEPKKFINALQYSKFLDDMKIHDWQSFAGKLIRDRLYKESTRSLRESTGDAKSTPKAVTKPSLYQAKPKEKKGEAFIKPSVQDIETYCLERKNNINPQSFFDFYESKGWMIGKNRVKNWQACVRTWESRQQFDQSIGNSPGSGSPNGYFDDILNIKQKLKQEAIKNGVQG